MTWNFKKPNKPLTHDFTTGWNSLLLLIYAEAEYSDYAEHIGREEYLLDLLGDGWDWNILNEDGNKIFIANYFNSINECASPVCLICSIRKS